MRRYLEHFLDLCKNRIFVMLCGVIVLFAIIVLRLFSLQIIHGEYYDERFQNTACGSLSREYL